MMAVAPVGDPGALAAAEAAASFASLRMVAKGGVEARVGAVTAAADNHRFDFNRNDDGARQFDGNRDFPEVFAHESDGRFGARNRRVFGGRRCDGCWVCGVAVENCAEGESCDDD